MNITTVGEMILDELKNVKAGQYDPSNDRYIPIDKEIGCVVYNPEQRKLTRSILPDDILRQEYCSPFDIMNYIQFRLHQCKDEYHIKNIFKIYHEYDRQVQMDSMPYYKKLDAVYAEMMSKKSPVRFPVGLISVLYQLDDYPEFVRVWFDRGVFVLSSIMDVFSYEPAPPTFINFDCPLYTDQISFEEFYQICKNPQQKR